jgi:hypothetical protein
MPIWAKWYKQLQPTTPPPMTTTFAYSVISVSMDPRPATPIASTAHSGRFCQQIIESFVKFVPDISQPYNLMEFF